MLQSRHMPHQITEFYTSAHTSELPSDISTMDRYTNYHCFNSVSKAGRLKGAEITNICAELNPLTRYISNGFARR